MYLVTLTQHRKHPRPTKICSEPNGTESRRKHITEPTIQKILDIKIMIDQQLNSFAFSLNLRSSQLICAVFSAISLACDLDSSSNFSQFLIDSCHLVLNLSFLTLILLRLIFYKQYENYILLTQKQAFFSINFSFSMYFRRISLYILARLKKQRMIKIVEAAARMKTNEIVTVSMGLAAKPVNESQFICCK